MKLLLMSWTPALNVARHVRWYLSYQISGETRSGE